MTAPKPVDTIATMSDAPTPMSTADWAGDSARRWALHADRLEAQLEPVSDVLFAAARLAPGMQVLDVGCGRGATTRRAAAIVGPTGSVLGVDVAESLIAEARVRCDISNVTWIRADAQRHEFIAEYDALISRFGVMFFDDAVAAFANLRRAALPGACLTMITWQPRDRSEFFEVPLRLGRQIAEQIGLSVAVDELPVDGGPFSFGVPDHVRRVLGKAGWGSVDIELQSIDLYNGGPGTCAVAAEVSLAIGPLRATLEHATAEQRSEVGRRLATAFEPYHDGTGVRLEGAIAVVRASA